jgi:hypothetical protein
VTTETASSDTTARPPAPAKKKRGRESVGDMVRSLSLVLLGVVVVWWFAQAPASDEAELRVVDPSGDLAAFTTDVPQTPVPTGLPEQWRPTSSTRTGASELRVGYVTPEGQYAEYAAATDADGFVRDITGFETDGGRQLEPVDVDGVAWEQYRDSDGSLSLVRSAGPVTVVVGTTRATATQEELVALVRSLAVR